MNIKDYSPKYIDIETPMKDVAYGDGTFKEILDGVYNDKIYPLTDASGRVVGMNVESGKTGAEDSLEMRKFERRYSGIDVMRYFKVAMDLRYNRHAEIESVDETNGVHVTLVGGEIVEVVPGRQERHHAEHPELPDSLNIPEGDLANYPGGINNAIKRYLKDTYNHYLAGGVDKQFDAELEEVDGGLCWKVTNIKWGRKV